MKKVKFLGYAITAISFYYILKVILNLNFDIFTLRHPLRSILSILFFSILYTFLVYIASLSWKLILEFLSRSNLSSREVFEVYAKSNIAKYLPGNILHFAGRNILGRRLGWKHTDILVSSFLEMFMMVLAAFFLLLIFSYNDSVGLLTQLFSTIGQNRMIRSFLLAAIGILIFIGICFLVKRSIPFGNLKLFFTRRFSILVFEVFLIDCFLLLSLGFILVLIYQGVLGGPVKITRPLNIISGFILSWVAGFMTPGAPGGIGVRESILILMLSPAYGKESALMAALLFRGVSIMGEVFSFVYVSLASRHQKKRLPTAS